MRYLSFWTGLKIVYSVNKAFIHFPKTEREGIIKFSNGKTAGPFRNVQGTGNIYKVESQCLHLKLGSYALVRQTFTLSP